jgi:hypothetical protein
MDVFVSVYLPVKGWAMVVYGDDGPSYTGMGHSTLQAAINEAICESKDTKLPLQITGLYICPKCFNVAMITEKCDCGHESPEYIEKRKVWDALLDKCKARDESLHTCPKDQEIFGQ